ncbi:MNIO family bufferin maturase (plasmid) [Paraburkholderia strydomiana]
MRTLTDADTGVAHRHLRPPSPNMKGLAGASFKHEHLAAILEERPHDTFFEVHAENYMGAGGPAHRALENIRNRHPLSIHGVCVSLGGAQPLDADHLNRFRDVCNRYEPDLVSEHLAWSSHSGAFYNDLLPLPYTQDTLSHVCAHVEQVQDAIRRPLLLENPSTYVTFASSSMSEPEFLKAVTVRTGCGLLLDINNVFVSTTNHGYDAKTYLDEFPLNAVRQIHLAGHTRQQDTEAASLLIDSHDAPVSDAVWALYDEVTARVAQIPTLIEWDSALPEWKVLWAEVVKARQRMDGSRPSPMGGRADVC